MPSDDTPDLTRERCLGVVVGNCLFSDRLRRRIVERIGPCHVFSWTRHMPGQLAMDPLDIEDGMQLLKEYGITHIICAGSIHLELLRPRPEDVSDLSDVRKRGLERLSSPLSFYSHVYENLAEAGLYPLSVREVSDDFSAWQGVMGRVAPARPMGILPSLKSQASGCGATELYRGNVKAVVFDVGGTRQPVIETHDTNSFLRALDNKEAGAWRVLVKILPHPLLTRLDDPIIGVATIEDAVRAGVDVIAIDTHHGIIVDRAETIAAADAASIALVGV